MKSSILVMLITVVAVIFGYLLYSDIANRSVLYPAMFLSVLAMVFCPKHWLPVSWRDQN